ncbi:hypothetical protein BCR35DRAFT_325387 [Leucosporidium creatinivorum]|uniref:Protein kinase domain-containing protein n=1 Tax=Leucosporidium creatinivorum TaxID=106004 RepID=A0A1Y2F4R7_9BASI|nr:hypothetical protein BCR35DRAFT_325387 [Leucosporidium creatinivorum]
MVTLESSHSMDQPLPHYKLGEKLGQGSFGSVYRALNWTTGETVAVKQIGLANIPKSDLPDIMSEIDLLKNLNHPNIVQYRGYTATTTHLYIILEYCENGSLHAIVKKFGRFPESLVALYVLQVLQGLVYLHDQGVIHRDIKGSNILANKEGGIKLADFGVATHTSSLSTSAVVGSPYWMAPEIVDQSGATTSSDIWSLGALVIELLTGKPPYHHLDPMPALFRIVNDPDGPPIPEGASAVVRDFLGYCFQKDGMLRVGARRLLRHPWMVAARRGVEEREASSSSAGGSRTGRALGVPGGGGGGARPKSGYDDGVQRVQEWNEAIRANPTPLPAPNLTPSSATANPSLSPRLLRRPSAELASALALHPAPPPVLAPPPPPKGLSTSPNRAVSGLALVVGSKAPNLSPKRELSGKKRSPPSASMAAVGGVGKAGGRLRAITSASVAEATKRGREKVAHDVEEEEGQQGEDGEEGGDNWDEDFEEGISMSKIAALDRTDSSPSSTSSSSDSDGSDSDDEEEDQDGTIRPSNLLSPLSAKPPAKAKMVMSPVVEDYSDLIEGDDEEEGEGFEGKVRRLREANLSRPRLLHPKDLAADSFTSSAPSSPFSSSVRGLRTLSPSPLKPLPSSPSPAPPARQPLAPLQRSPLKSSASTTSLRPTKPVAKHGIHKYSEQEGEEEDYSDVFGGGGGGGVVLLRGKEVEEEGEKERSLHLQSLQLSTKLSSKSWLGDEDSDEDDPFALVDSEDSDSLATRDALGGGGGEVEASVAREKLAGLQKGVEECVERLGGEDEFETREGCLELITILELSPEVKPHFVKSHGMLAVIEVLQVTRSREILGILLRVVNLIVGEDPDTLEKLCLVGGCPVVMSFASNKFSREIRLEAALFIGSMCRTSLLTMFVSCRGLRTLVEMMDENYAERKDLVWMAVDGISRVFEMHGPTPRNDFCRIFSHEGLLEPLSSALISVAVDDDDLAVSAKAKIIGIFLLFSQSDRKVKEAMACRAVVLRLVKALRMLTPDLLAPLLKTIKNLTMLPSALEVLQNANSIEILVGILAEPFEGKLGAEIQNHVVNALFNLCRLSSIRQEEAAIAGAIPILQHIVLGSSPLKQFALPILCDFAHASKTCRKLLWKHDGLNFYLTLLRDSFWANPALEAILSWLQDETARVEDCLLEATALESLLRVFCKTKSATFESLLEPFHKLLRTSPAVSIRLASSSTFFKRIIDRLTRTSISGKAVTRLNLLRITKTVFDALPLSQRDKVVKILLLPVGRLAEEDPAILVKELAKELKREFGRVREGGRREVQKRVLRRAASEGGAVGGGGGSVGGVPPSPGGVGSARRQGNMFGRGA